MTRPEGEGPLDPEREYELLLPFSSLGTPDAVHARDQGRAANRDYEIAETLFNSVFPQKLYKGEAPKEPGERRKQGASHLPVEVVRADLVAPGTEIKVYPSRTPNMPYTATIESMSTPISQPNNSAVIIREGHGRGTVRSSIAGATKVKPAASSK